MVKMTNALLNSSMIYHKLGQYEQAYSMLEKFNDIYIPKYGIGYKVYYAGFLIASILCDDMDEPQRALEVIQDLFDKYENDPENREKYPDVYPNLFNVRGHIYKKMKEYDKSISDLRKSIELEAEISGNDNIRTLNNIEDLADALNEAGRKEEALEEIRKVVDIIRKNNLSGIRQKNTKFALYAKILSETGDQSGAEELIEKTIQDARNEKDSDIPDILKKAVEIFEISNTAKALEYAKRLSEHRKLYGNAKQQEEANDILNRINEAIHK